MNVALLGKGKEQLNGKRTQETLAIEIPLVIFFLHLSACRRQVQE